MNLESEGEKETKGPLSLNTGREMEPEEFPTKGPVQFTLLSNRF